MISKVINTIIHIIIASIGLLGVLIYPFHDEVYGKLPERSELIEVTRVIEWAEIKKDKYSHSISLKLSDIDVVECDISASHLSDEGILNKIKSHNVVSVLTEEEEYSRCYAIGVNGEAILSYDKFVEDYWWDMSLMAWFGGFIFFISVYEYRKLLKHWRSPRLKVRSI